ncbi:MAG: hypothetical protein ACR2H3_16765 [Acidimicrobiales bacterium]
MSAAGVDNWSDERLAVATGALLAQPKAAEADSFVLHASLELLARVLLLSKVSVAQRNAARARLAVLGTLFAHSGDAVHVPKPIDPKGVPEALDRLVAALEAGDLDNGLLTG